MDVELHDTICGQCRGIADLQVVFSDGATVTLCPICDEDGPQSADALLRFLGRHPRLDDAPLGEFAGLLNEWLIDVAPVSVTDTELAAVVREWSGPSAERGP